MGAATASPLLRWRQWLASRLSWLAVVLLLALLVKAVDPVVLWRALRQANLWLLPPLVGATLVSLLLRSIRWHLLMKAVGGPNSLLDSIILFTAAQAALFVPGGQFLLPVLQRRQHGTLLRLAIPTILVQELVYGLMLLPLALPGVPPYHAAGWLLLLGLIFNAGMGIALLHGGLIRVALRLSQRIPFLAPHLRLNHFADLQHHFKTVARHSLAIWGTLFDAGALGLAGVGFLLALRAVGSTQLTWLDGAAVYALGSTVGTLSALPGGVGANEDLSTLVLTHMGLAAGQAAAATLLFRGVGMVGTTAAGWLVLWLARRRLKLRPTLANLAAVVQTVERRALFGVDQPAEGDACGD